MRYVKKPKSEPCTPTNRQPGCFTCAQQAIETCLGNTGAIPCRCGKPSRVCYSIMCGCWDVVCSDSENESVKHGQPWITEKHGWGTGDTREEAVKVWNGTTNAQPA